LNQQSAKFGLISSHTSPNHLFH